ncbi:MAG: PASTA domain-containing protein [Planctomycetota bacterium]
MLLCVACNEKNAETNEIANAQDQPDQPFSLADITAGMSLEDAIEQLENAGFKPDKKYDPTGNGTYFQTNVPLGRNIGTLESAEYAVTGTNKAFGSEKYLVIKSDPQGRIISVE